jgi:hypothetical protein
VRFASRVVVFCDGMQVGIGLLSSGRRQVSGFRGNVALCRSSTARHVNRALLERINRSAPENSISATRQFSGTESINLKEWISVYEGCHLRTRKEERRVPFED